MADMNNPFEELGYKLNLVLSILSKLIEKSEQTKEKNEKIKLLDEMPDQLQTKHLILLFGKTPVTFWSWENKRILKPQRINGRKFYAKSDIMKLLNQK